MAQQIIEDGLTFDFNAGWDAEKYDDWTFFKKQFGSVCNLCDGIKAVDIVAYGRGTAWLIEVKDYRRHRRTKTIDLADEVAKKVFDTLSGLVAAKYNATNTVERSMANQILNQTSLNVVLHLEQPLKHSKLFPRVIDPSNIQKKLRKQLKAIDPHVNVLEKTTTNSRTHWKVS